MLGGIVLEMSQEVMGEIERGSKSPPGQTGNMEFGLQKANGGKRIAAFLFDAILLSILAVGIGCLFSLVSGYNRQAQIFEDAMIRYEKEYGVQLRISEETFLAMNQEEKKQYEKAYAALTEDEEAMRAYQTTMNLMLLMVTFSLLGAFLILEFVLPLKLGHGRTLGKKIFGLAVMDTESVRIRPASLFARTVLGKYAVETMVPAYVITMFVFGFASLISLLVLLALLIIQPVLYFTSRTHALLHDKIASTVVVDYASQMIFDSHEEMLQAKKKAAAEKAKSEEW